MAEDPKLDERFEFSDMIGGGNFLSRKLQSSIPEDVQDRNRREFQAWVKHPEVAPCLEQLLFTYRVDRVSPGFDPASEAIQDRKSCFVAHVRNYCSEDPQPDRVRGILDSLIGTGFDLCVLSSIWHPSYPASFTKARKKGGYATGK